MSLWLLNVHRDLLPLRPGHPVVLGRSRHGLPNHTSISRDHCRLEGTPDGTAVRLTQLGRHPCLIYRHGLLSFAGWTSGSRPKGGEAVEQGATVLLHPGDAFGIRTDDGARPHWITNDQEATAITAPPPAARAARASSPSLDVTPPRSRDPSPPSRHISSSELSPSKPHGGSLVGPTSAFYQQLRTESVERAMRQAMDADTDMHGAASPQRRASELIAIPVLGKLEANRLLEADRVDKERQKREQAEWSLDMYPAAKRARVEKANREAINLAEKGNAAATPAAAGRAPAAGAPKPAAAASILAAAAGGALPPASATTASSSSAAAASVSSPSSPSPPAPSPPPPSPTLVLPPLSVFDFHFSTEKANPLACHALQAFLALHGPEVEPDLRIIMVVPGKDGVPADGAAKDVFDFFTARQMDARFSIRVGDLTDLASLGVRASFLVHPTTWRFVGGEGGRIARWMPSDFSDRLTAKHQEAKVGWSYVTAVPDTCELAKRCPGLHALITVRPPNMNDARPDSLRGNYMKGCQQLTAAYGALLMAFGGKLKSNQPGKEPAAAATAQPSPAASTPASSASLGTPSPHLVTPPPPALGSSPSPSPSFSLGSPSFSPSPATQQLVHPLSGLTPASAAAASPRVSPGMAPIPAQMGRVSPFPGGATSSSTAAASSSSSSSSSSFGRSSFLPPLHTPAYTPPSGKPATTGHFSVALYEYIQSPRPSRLEPWVYWEDDDFCAVYDCFPKARRHLLLLPKKEKVASVTQLGVGQLHLVEEMEARGRWLCAVLQYADAHGKVVPVRRGFHARPSLKLLHLHIISQDFDSPWLKQKNHWQSFTTGFFVQPNRIREMIRAAPAAATPTQNFFAPRSDDRAKAAAAATAVAGETLEHQLQLGEKLLTGDLRCHRVACGTKCMNIPELKTHLSMCAFKPYPEQAP